ncbi:hypothetical protein B0T25DRAFT_61953 [Lasiosphaeria hispida]|uniref:Uncharacterized protein n=1 Tax=Lasiosphaeria hispida TaxID=260671 RepID=A0AAJ0ML11_9PEZI|nr:hypothetical protein B0T25DRAFT_61953 [Lasiosphaeria hispida]
MMCRLSYAAKASGFASSRSADDVSEAPRETDLLHLPVPTPIDGETRPVTSREAPPADARRASGMRRASGIESRRHEATTAGLYHVVLSWQLFVCPECPPRLSVCPHRSRGAGYSGQRDAPPPERETRPFGNWALLRSASGTAASAASRSTSEGISRRALSRVGPCDVKGCPAVRGLLPVVFSPGGAARARRPGGVEAGEGESGTKERDRGCQAQEIIPML